MKKFVSLIMMLVLALSMMTTPAMAEAPVDLLWVPTVLNGSSIYPGSDSFVAQKINEMFNVNITVQEVNSQKNDEMALMYASGIIPDVNPIFPNYFYSYYDQGLFREIPMDMLKEYAPTYYEFASQCINFDTMPSMVEGKLYGLPHTTNPPPNLSVIRTDWLEKLGLAVPTTLEEFEEVCRAFAQDDPDGDGVADTWALAWGSKWTSNFQFISAAFGLETDYLVDENGLLMDKRVSENYKEYLKYLQKLYQAGYIYPDLTLPTKDNISELLTNGTIGYFNDTYTWFMPLYRPSAYYARLFDQNPEAKTAYVAPFTNVYTGEKSTLQVGAQAWVYTCIGANTTDEQLIKILQIFEKQCADPYFHNLIWRGEENVHYTLNEDGMAIYTDAYAVLDEQQKAGLKTFFINMRFGEQLVWSYGKEVGVQMDFIAQNFAPLTEPHIPTNTYNAAALELSADVNAIADEFFMRALSSTMDIDAEWDAYVKNMNKSGLAEIMDEYNAVWTAK